MATIEERAKRYCIENYTCKKTVHAYMGYVDGATEQRKIDIEKACEWLLENANCWMVMKQEMFVQEFRKAMEE